MLDPGRVALDHDLLVLGLTSYVVATLVLTAYFLSRSEALKRAGIALAICGCALQFAELAARWYMSGVWPLTNLYGSLSLFSGLGVLGYLILARKYDMWLIGGGVLAISSIALGYATTWNEGYMPAVPALQSYWIKVHVPIVVASYASFMVAFVVSALYVFKAYAARRFQVTNAVTASASSSTAVNVQEPFAQWLSALPSLARLDMLTYRIVGIGLVLLSVGIITGAMWANEAWGAYWSWDPKETAALLSWIIYAALMHLRTRNAWRGERSAWLSILGFVSIMFCYLGVNIWISGLHSYKM